MSEPTPPSEPRAGIPVDPRGDGAGASGPLMYIAGVRLRPGGRSFTCDAGRLSLHVGTRVVVQADHGPEVGIVMVAPAWRPTTRRVPRILRIADERDLARAQADGQRASEALNFARQAVRERNLAVKLFHAELHGGGRATFYFASEARIDFRDLVRVLSDRLRMRVEMRQVGVRDEAKMVGGIGSCGRELCCSTFLQRFAPISIKAAKNQNIALTPSKVTGQCGRLKCCLVYEEANYVEAAKSLPRMGKRVETPDGVGRVGDLDVLRGRVRVLFPDGPPKVYQGDELKAAAPLPAEMGPSGPKPDRNGSGNRQGGGAGPRGRAGGGTGTGGAGGGTGGNESKGGGSDGGGAGGGGGHGNNNGPR